MNIAASFRKWNSFRRTVRELESLDDRALHDLGLTRGEIRFVARNQAARV
ncbi:DUF1127 domain-containing protein [Cucumibacter marinus]|jgi:uncharacterized protein YjiS (DUF1127 family)|nr:DUF1127 domain-containing protein [Cucumibacter marinus]